MTGPFFDSLEWGVLDPVFLTDPTHRIRSPALLPAYLRAAILPGYDACKLLPTAPLNVDGRVMVGVPPHTTRHTMEQPPLTGALVAHVEHTARLVGVCRVDRDRRDAIYRQLLQQHPVLREVHVSAQQKILTANFS